MQTLTYSGSLAKECISFINKQQQPGTVWKDIIYLFMHLFIFFIYSNINITYNAMSPTHDDSCSPSQTLYAWLSRHHVPWVPHHRQSWLRSPSPNALPVSAPHTKKCNSQLRLNVMFRGCRHQTSRSPPTYIPSQRESCPFLAGRTWGCSCTGHCSALCSLSRWQCHAHAPQG